MITAQPQRTPVPPLNLAANFRQVREEILREFAEICDSGYYILGPKVAAFEEALARACGVRHALGLSSGTDALLVALMALEIGPGHEVIVPTFTFFATAGCVARVGAKPVFCDTDPTTFNMDPKDIESRITPRTKAIIPVHLYGQLAEMGPILEIARRHRLAVIEDAAQAIGAHEPGPGGRQAGAIGDFGALSFYPTKNLGAIGDAGALLANDAKLYERAKQLRLHGETQRYHHQFIGGNFRIDALQAAFLHIKLKHLNEWTAQRRARAACYDELLRAAALDPDDVRPPSEKHGLHVYHQYVVRARRRDELVKWLGDRGIGSGIYYPIPLHLQECFAYLGGRPGQFPHSEAAAREVLALPMYPELTDEAQATVIHAVSDFYRAPR